jgi:hypothetical protein
MLPAFGLLLKHVALSPLSRVGDSSLLQRTVLSYNTVSPKIFQYFLACRGLRGTSSARLGAIHPDISVTSRSALAQFSALLLDNPQPRITPGAVAGLLQRGFQFASRFLASLRMGINNERRLGFGP